MYFIHLFKKQVKWMYFATKTRFHYFLTTQNLSVRFMEVYIFSGSKESVHFNQVSALQCPLYKGYFMCVY